MARSGIASNTNLPYYKLVESQYVNKMNKKMRPKYDFGDTLYYPKYDWFGSFESIEKLTVRRIALEKDAFTYSDIIGDTIPESQLFLTENEAKACAYIQVYHSVIKMYRTVADFKKYVKEEKIQEK